MAQRKYSESKSIPNEYVRLAIFISFTISVPGEYELVFIVLWLHCLNRLCRVEQNSKMKKNENIRRTQISCGGLCLQFVVNVKCVCESDDRTLILVLACAHSLVASQHSHFRLLCSLYAISTAL